MSAPLKWSPFTPIRGTVISECCESDDQRLLQKALLSFVLVRARPVLTSICGGVLCTFLVDSLVAGSPRSALFQGWDGGHSVGIVRRSHSRKEIPSSLQKSGQRECLVR